MNMAENIRALREQANMYQSDLGKALGVSAQAVSKWELGKAEPDMECILKMCELFGVSADQLLGRDGETEEEWMFREKIRRDPTWRLLFETANKASAEHIRAAAEMLKALGPKDDDND